MAEMKSVNMASVARNTIPVYQKIKNILEKQIITHQIDILSERQIIHNFNVSTITARRVLNELEDEGFLVRKVGKGSIVLKQQERIIDLGIIVFKLYSPEKAFISQIINGIEKKAVSNNSQLNFHLHTTRKKTISENPTSLLYHAVVKKKLNGVFVLSPIPSEDLIFLQENRIPFVIVNDEYPDLKVNTVVFDHYDAVYKMMEKLTSSGYKKISVLAGPSGKKNNVLRGGDKIVKAYLDFTKKNTISYQLIIEKEHSEKEGYDVLKEVASLPSEKKPDALIIASGALGKGAYKYVSENKNSKILLVPYVEEKIYHHPSIFIPLQLLGEIAFNLLDKNIKNNSKKAEKITVPLKLLFP